MQSYSKDHEILQEAFADMMDKIFVVSKFAVVACESILERKRTVPSCARRIAEQIFDGAAVYPTNQELNANSIERKIGEFIQIVDPSVVAVDLDNELGLYVKKSVSQIVEQVAGAPKPLEETKAGDFAAQLASTIQKYERIISDQRTNGVNPASAPGLVEAMKRQLAEYLARTKGSTPVHTPSPPKTRSSRFRLTKQRIINRDQTRTETLHEIFQFYNRQRALACIRKTFDAVGEEANLMPLGYFVKVLKDFDIGIGLKVWIARPLRRKSRNCT